VIVAFRRRVSLPDTVCYATHVAPAARDPVFDAPLVDALIELALAEDLGEGDRTSQALVPAGARARGRLAAKQSLVVCGLPLIELVFDHLGEVAVTLHAEDGHRAAPAEVLAVVEGPARALLAGERLILNLVQHLSGIATLTRACVDAVAGSRLVVRDTRKTVPGLRLLAKYAVRVGGGTNHRMALDDAILIKDNHLAFAGGDVAAAVGRARAAAPRLPLEIECRTLVEVAAAVPAKPDLILLDNMSLADVTAAVELVAGRVPLEVSGGVGPEDLPALASTGADFVAMGALTHSAGAVDLHLKMEPMP
jgi:nicotinate-nucleotide pyrophosphorylase (carboxylating)